MTQLRVSKSPYALTVDVGKRLPASLIVNAIITGASNGGLFPRPGAIEADLMDAFQGKLFADCMIFLRENPERYAKQFARYIRFGIGPDDIIPMYRHAFDAICASPQSFRKKPLK
jgi:hypothetical protein